VIQKVRKCELDWINGEWVCIQPLQYWRYGFKYGKPGIGSVLSNKPFVVDTELLNAFKVGYCLHIFIRLVVQSVRKWRIQYDGAKWEFLGPLVHWHYLHKNSNNGIVPNIKDPLVFGSRLTNVLEVGIFV